MESSFKEDLKGFAWNSCHLWCAEPAVSQTLSDFRLSTKAAAAMTAEPGDAALRHLKDLKQRRLNASEYKSQLCLLKVIFKN